MKVLATSTIRVLYDNAEDVPTVRMHLLKTLLESQYDGNESVGQQNYADVNVKAEEFIEYNVDYSDILKEELDKPRGKRLTKFQCDFCHANLSEQELSEFRWANASNMHIECLDIRNGIKINDK